MAGIAVKNAPQKNERIASMRLTIAISAMRGAGTEADEGTGGGAS
jgi:hypothetical protein